jgi:sec-independent protein translocase protein TatC
MLLVKLGIITTQQLREARRYVIVGAFVIAAVLTPPDVLSQFMLAVPLLLLYELGIFLSGFITARSRAPQEEEVVKTTDANRPTDVTKPNDAG